MADAAFAQFQKIFRQCPNCGVNGPKELMAGPLETQWFKLLILLCCTCGIALFFPSWWRKASLTAHCGACNKTFNPGSI